MGVWDILNSRCHWEVQKGDTSPSGEDRRVLFSLMGPICIFRFRGGGQPKDSS